MPKKRTTKRRSSSAAASAKKKSVKKTAAKRKAPAKKTTAAKKKSAQKTPAKKAAQQGASLPAKKAASAVVRITPDKAAHVPTFQPRPSKHIVDLKRLMHEKEVRHSKEQSYARYLEDTIKDTLVRKKKHATDLPKKVYNRLPTKKIKQIDVFRHSLPNESVVSHVDLTEKKAAPTPQKAKRQARITGIKMPRIAIPSVSLPSLRVPSFSSKHFSLTAYGIRAVASFIIASFIITSPLMAYDYYLKLQNQKGQVLGVTATAVDHVRKSIDTASLKRYDAAQYELGQAYALFDSAQKELDNLPGLVKLIINALPQQDEYQTANALLDIAQTGTAISYSILGAFNGQEELPLTDKLSHIITVLEQNEKRIKNLAGLAESIDYSVVPQQYRSSLEEMLRIFPLLSAHIDTVTETAGLINTMIGAQQAQRYLFVFQNNNEIRATGGFIGSLAEIDFDRGRIQNITIPHGGPYDLRGGLTTAIQAPRPLSVLNPRWEFQDANYFADFPTSARKLMRFYETSGKSSVDGIIAINATFMEDLLNVIGSITTPDGVELNADNFIDEVQMEVEFGKDKEQGEPKKLIAELAPQILETLLSAEGPAVVDLMRVFAHALNTRDIQLYFADTELQAFAREQQWDGSLAQTAGDYLSIVSTNIAGGKTDTLLEDVVDLRVDITDAGEIFNTVTISRTHNGVPGHPLSGVKNNDYVRFYVPLNSTLVSASGFEPIPEFYFRSLENPTDSDFTLDAIQSTRVTDEETGTETFQEGGKTVFANWIQTPVGKTVTAQISYKLPFTLAHVDDNTTPSRWLDIIKNEFGGGVSQYEKYSLYVQKQSGKEHQTLDVTINTPYNLSYTWTYPSSLVPSDNATYTVSSYPLTEDAFFGIILEKK